jgi:hypothetical protein
MHTDSFAIEEEAPMEPSPEDQYHSYPNDRSAGYDEDGEAVCPSYTTERKLVTKIDLRVIPFLCIMYLLAFLDRYVTTKSRQAHAMLTLDSIN